MYTEEQYILEIGQALADDHAAVMVGAGFSKNAEKISTAGREFLNWNQLSDLFYEKLYGDSEYPGKNYCSSLRLAEEVEIMVGRPGLEKILKQKFRMRIFKFFFTHKLSFPPYKGFYLRCSR